MLNLSAFVGGGGGGLFYVIVFNAYFFEFRANKSFSCETDRIWKNIFFDKIFNIHIAY